MFKYPSVLTRHQDGPLAKERESYLSHRASGGVAFTTLQRLARELLVIAREISPIKSTVELKEIEEFANLWAHRQKRCHRLKKLKWSRELFISVAIDWFRFPGRFQECLASDSPFSEITETFADYMHDER